jgi:hypothetical protein
MRLEIKATAECLHSTESGPCRNRMSLARHALDQSVEAFAEAADKLFREHGWTRPGRLWRCPLHRDK